MTPYREVVQDQAGNVQPGRAVAVTIHGTTTAAPIYSDAAGLSPIPGGIVTTDSNGVLEFWSPGGTLTLTVTSTGTVINNVYIAPTIVSSLMSSRVVLAGLALAGGIPSSATSVMAGCNTTPGDEGGVPFRRCSAAEFAAFGLSAETAALVSFLDASGDRWLIDTPNPHLASVGCFPQPLGVAPVASSATSCRPYVVALSEFLSKTRTNGGVIRYGRGNYYFHEDTALDDYVGISGPETQGRESLASGEIDAVGGVDFVPGIVHRSSTTFEIGDNFYSDYLCVKRQGIAQHTTMAGALDMQMSFAGTGIKKRGTGSARNVTIRNFVAYGFEIGLDGYKMPGCRIGDHYGDCLILVMLRDSGETCWLKPGKRKPSLSNNDTIKPRTITVTGLFDSGGYVGVTTAEDVIANGLTTGQRIGNNKLPAAFVNLRRTVTVLGANSVRLNDEPWSSDYASFTLTDRSNITFQPSGGAGVTAFYNASGKVGVRTAVAMPFTVGHYAILGCGELPPRGFRRIHQVISTTDFVVDVAWDAALLSFNMRDAELSAMPNNRRMSSASPYWGTTEAFATALINCDGARVEVAHKGNGGVYCDSGSVNLEMSNEGGSIGETDLDDPDSRGLVTTQPRTVVTGALKSTGLAWDVVMETSADKCFGYGMQLTDNGVGSLRVTTGGVTIVGARTKGAGRLLVSNPSGVDILEGDFTSASVVGSAADKKKVALRWRSGDEVREIAGVWQQSVWDSSGNDLVVYRATENGVYTRPQAYTSTGTVGAAVVTLTTYHHGCDIELTTNTATIILDATTVPDGFKFTVRNHRPAGDWTIPTSWGSGVVMQYAKGVSHTKLSALGWADFVVRVISGTRYLLIRGDTAA